MRHLSAPARWYRAQLRFGRQLERCVFIALLLLLLWLPLPFGSHRPWAEMLLVLAAATLILVWGLAWGLSNLRVRHVDRAAVLVLLLWALWLGWIWLQTQPWPLSQLADWSPLRWQHLQALGQMPGGVLPLQAPLSVDAGLTHGQLLVSAGYGLLFLLIMLTLSRRSRHKWLLWTLLASGLLQAGYGSAMVLSGVEYGAWGAKEEYHGFATGTFVNRNHFAGYLELCLGAALGLVIATSPQRQGDMDWRQRLRHFLAMLQDGPMFARGCMAILFIGLILSQSRMGNVAAIGGLTLTGLAYVLCRPRTRMLRWLLLLGSILLVDVLLFGRWFGLEQLAARYATAQPAADLRLQVLDDVRPMIAAFAPFGSGLGTFGLAYPEFRSPAINWGFDEAHNDYAQFLIETGYGGALVLAVLAALTAARALMVIRRRGDPLVRGTACATLAALAALSIHSLADFNLQIPANAATLVVLMGAVWACPVRRRPRRAATPRQNGSGRAVL